MNDLNVEQEIQAKGLTAPRVTPEMVEAEIVSEWYINGGDAKPNDFQPPVPDGHALTRLTFCILVLRNGFTVTGESACASPENFDAELGQQIARRNAVSKIWGHLGFRLRDDLAGITGKFTADDIKEAHHNGVIFGKAAAKQEGA